MRIGRLMLVVGLGAFLATASPPLRDAHAANAFEGSTLAGTWHFHFEAMPAFPENNIPSTMAAVGWFTTQVSATDPNLLNVTGGKAWINTGVSSVDGLLNWAFPISGGTLYLRDSNVGVYGTVYQEHAIQISGFVLEYCQIMLDDRRGQSGRMVGRLKFFDSSLFGTAVVSGTVTKE